MIDVKNQIPEQSMLRTTSDSFGYIDSFQSCFSSKDESVNIDTIAHLFLTGGPKWVDSLLMLRNKLVGVFGLKTPMPGNTDKQDQTIDYQPGEKAGLFKVFAKSENELLLGEDDKHLDFRVSILLEPLNDGTNTKKIALTTAVKFNNWFGKLYFFPVKPFHRFIVHSAVKELVAQVEKAL